MAKGKDKEFFKLILKIALPLALQNLITFLVGMMDTLMLGRLGEVAISASALGNQVFFIFMITNFGLANGANILIAQYWGKGDTKTIKRIFAITYKIDFFLALIFACMAWFAPEFLLSIFTEDPAVILEGSKYLRIVGVSFFFYAIACPTTMTLRALQTVRISIVVYTTSLVVNVFFNWVFIFGNLGAPRLGVAGAAIATSIARFCEMVVAVVYLFGFEKKLRLKPRELLSFDKSLLPDFKSYVMPVMCNEILWSCGASLIAVIVGRMGTIYVAANSISTVLNNLVTVVIFGVSSSAAVITGNTAGMGDLELTRQRAHKFMALSVVLGACACAVTILARPFVVSLYSVSDETKEIAMQIMFSMAIIVFFQSFASTSMMGILRGGGDGKFVMVADVIFLWTLSAPIGSLLGLVFHLPAWIVFLALKCDEIFKCGIALWRLSGDKWLRDVTR